MKEIIDKIFLIMLCSLIAISSIFVGSPLKHNYLVLSAIVNALAFIYLCIKIVIEPKRNWLDNSLCVAVFMLTVSSCIPIIFQKCVSLSDAIQSVLIYISLFSVFIMLKEIQTKNKEKYIVYSIIISAVISCIIGFDNLTFNTFERVLRKLGNASFVNQDHRMFANFGYANAFALYVAVALLLTLNEYKQIEKMWGKMLNIALMTLFEICILLSYSRGTWICLTICSIFNIIFDKDRKIKLRQIGILALTGIMSLLFIKIYNKLYSASQYLFIYFWLIITLMISSFVQLTIQLIKNKIKIKKKINIKMKYIVIVVMVVGVLIIITFIYLLKYTKPLVLFNTLNGEDEYIQNINYVSDEDGYYDIAIDLDAKSSLKDKFAYEIVIKERNKYNDIVFSHSILVNNEKENKTIKFEKQEDTKYLTITYKSLYKSERRGLTINSLTIIYIYYLSNSLP